MKKNLVYFSIFGCIGITTEIFFTSISDAVVNALNNEVIDWRLVGKSYAWMFFIYGLAGILFPLVFEKIRNLNPFFRILIYVVSIFAIEYLSGWFLDVFTGSCPWFYTSKYAIHGYIRLDYAPFWAMFGLMLEKIFLAIERYVKL
jgi:uncharacterized membrane protein